MFLSLFFSMTSALLSTLIQLWAREYLQYSQSSDAPHKRGQTRTYLFDGLSQFQMRRLTHGVPILLHIAIFLFFFSISDWLHTINGLVGETACYCLIALLTVYMTLSILPLIFRNAPYQTPLTIPIRGCVSLIQVAYVILLRIMRRSSRAAEDLEIRKGFGLFHHIHLTRTRALKKEIKRKAAKLDESAMHWLVRQLDEDDMHTFLSSLPGYILSPLKDRKLVVEFLRENNVPWHIAAQLRICITSLELSQGACIFRASACIKSLRLISQTPPSANTSLSGSEARAIQSIMKDVDSFCEKNNTNASIALRASCIRALVIGEFLVPDTRLDTEELPSEKFPDYLKPLYRVIRVWKTTEVAQWPRLTGILPATNCLLPSDREMWADILYDGPLVNLTILAYAIISHASDEEANLHMAWKTLETLLKTLGLAQVWASGQARARFTEVLFNVDTRGSGGRGVLRANITPLLDTLNTVVRGLRLVEVLAYPPMPPPTQIEAVFGREQLRNSVLLQTFAANLPLHMATSDPKTSEAFMESLILEDDLWEQLHVNLSNVANSQVPLHDKIPVVTAVFDILDEAFVILKDSSIIDWQSRDFDLLIGCLMEFGKVVTVEPGVHIRKVAYFRVAFASVQFCHALLAQISKLYYGYDGQPFYVRSLYGLSALLLLLGLGNQEDMDYFTGKNAGVTPDLSSKLVTILNTALRDGPLSNICNLVRLTLDLLLKKAPDLNSKNITKSLAMLRRMLDTPYLSPANSSAEIWVKFAHLREAVRRAGSAVALESSIQNTDKFKSLLEMIEEVEHVRLAQVEHAEAPEDDNQTSPPTSEIMDQDTQYPDDVPIPESNRQAAQAFIPETGSPTVLSHNDFAQAPDANSPTSADQLPTPQIPMTYAGHPGPVADHGGFSSGFSYRLPRGEPRSYDTRYTAPFIPGSQPTYYSGTHPRFLGSTNLPAYAYIPPMLVCPPSQVSPVSPGRTHYARSRRNSADMY